MAWGTVGSLGGFSSKTSSTTLVNNALGGSNVQVGQVILVNTAWDNTDTASGVTTRLSCADSAGNVYTKALEYTLGLGSAEAGATVAIFYSVATVLLPVATGSITITSNTARIAKGMSARVLSIGAGNIVTVSGTQTAADNAIDPSSMSISGLENREYLFAHAMAAEAPDTDAYTASTSYVQFGQSGTTGGVADTNMDAVSEYRIFTSTGDTVNIASTTADRNYAQAYVALKEAAGNVTVTGIRATATATAKPGTTVIAAVAVAGVPATATATGQAGTVTLSKITITGVRASATATAKPGFPNIGFVTHALPPLWFWGTAVTTQHVYGSSSLELTATINSFGLAPLSHVTGSSSLPITITISTIPARWAVLLNRPASYPEVHVRIAFGGTHTNPIWSDITPYLRGVSWRTPIRSYDLERCQPGSATMVLDNRDRRFDPTNVNGPYYPLRRMRRLQIRTRWNGIVYYNWSGFIESFPPMWTIDRDATVELTAIDGSKVLQLADALPSTGIPQESTGARIARVLDAAGWNPNDRVLDTGLFQMAAVAAGPTGPEVYDHCLAAAEAERGSFRFDGQLRAVFRDGHYRKLYEGLSRATFGPGNLPYRAIQPVYDDAFLWNLARVTCEGTGNVFTSLDATSILNYYSRRWERSFPLALDTDAEAWADSIIYDYADPPIRIETMLASGAASPTTLWPILLGAEPDWHVVVQANPPGGGSFSQDQYIEGVEHYLTPETWDTTVHMSPADTVPYWVLGAAGQSELGQTTRLYR